MILWQCFEWDENKEIENIRKHKICFADATIVFSDKFLLKRYDEAHSLTESRYQILGRGSKILFVVYTKRGIWTRIISARLADKKEKEIYYGQNDKKDIVAWR